MLFGTNLSFRISYFFTSFCPAFILLLISVIDWKIFRWDDSKDKWSIYISRILPPIVFWIILLIFVITSICYIKKYLKNRLVQEYIVPNIVLNFNMHSVEFKNNRQEKVINIQESAKINSGFISFVSSTIAPSIVLKFMDGTNFGVALAIILIFFILSMLSNDVFPNFILPLFGINLMVTKDGYNIFYFSKDSETFTGVKRICSLGNAGNMARTFVYIDEEVLVER